MYNILTEHCPICGSINHITIHDDETNAWECYFCSGRFWLDDMCLTDYMVRHNCSMEQAENDLNMCHSNIVFAYGNYELELDNG